MSAISRFDRVSNLKPGGIGAVPRIARSVICERNDFAHTAMTCDNRRPMVVSSGFFNPVGVMSAGTCNGANLLATLIAISATLGHFPRLAQKLQTGTIGFAIDQLSLEISLRACRARATTVCTRK